MSVPANEVAHFVVVHAQIFSVFKMFLNMPSSANGLHHLLEGGCRWRKDKVVPLLLRIRDTAADEQPMSPIVLPLVQDGNQGPIKPPRSLGALAHREALPIVLSQHEGFHLFHFHPSASSLRHQYPNGFITGNR